MPAECNPERFEFAPLERRAVVAEFDGGAITSDAGSVLLGAVDRAIRLTRRCAACFIDRRCPELVEYRVDALIGQRLFGIAPGHADINDHDKPRHDPVMARRAGRFQTLRKDCAPVAGKSTFNRLELRLETAARHHKIAHDPAGIEALFVTLFLEPCKTPPDQPGRRRISR